MNAISVLEKDHHAVDRLFDQYARLHGTANRTATRRRELLKRITRELSVHAAIEEHELYPKIREVVPDGDGLAEEALKEHQEVKERLARLEDKDPDRAAFRSEFDKLVRGVRRHVEEERNEMFPRLREHMRAKDLNDLGTRLERAKYTAPTHPHPKAPNRPPANIVGDLAAGVVDRIRDAFDSVMPTGHAPAAVTPMRAAKRATASRRRRPAKAATRNRRRKEPAGGEAKRRGQTRKTKRAGAAKPRVMVAKSASRAKKRARR